MDKALKIALPGLLFNIAFGVYYSVAGVVTRSWWLFTLGVYYAILSVVRFVVLLRKGQDRFIVRFTGVMLIILSVPLIGTVLLALAKDRGNKTNEIVMIAMAAYAFTKITLAIVNLARMRKSNNARQISLRSISFADACVSIFALQRSMLVSFGDMSEGDIFIFNALLGAGVCIVAFLLGLGLLIKQKKLCYEHKHQ